MLVLRIWRRSGILFHRFPNARHEPDETPKPKKPPEFRSNLSEGKITS
jgi:hypothetical protein